MDIYSYKHPVGKMMPCPCKQHEHEYVFLKPLSQYAIEQAEQESKAFLSSNSCKPTGAMYELERCVRLLSRSIELSVDVIKNRLYFYEIMALYDQFEEVQQASFPNVEKLKSVIRKKINTDGDLMMDGLSAHKCKSAMEYYSQPMIELTQGQIAFYEVLSGAFAEFHIEGKDKQVSRKKIEN